MMHAPLPNIPTPFAQRLREMRYRFLPFLVVGAAIAAIAVLWGENLSAPQFAGQAESVLANLSSHKPGTVAMLNAHRFQTVQAGQALGQVLVADPLIVQNSLALIRSQIDSLKASSTPLVEQQRNAVNYAQLRLDWMHERTDLASVRVNLQLSEAEFNRQEQLFKDKIISANDMDIARANRDALQRQVAELEKLVIECENTFTNIQPSGAGQLSHITSDPMRAAIAELEAKLHLTEAELAPVILSAPINGIVSAIFHQSGESVTAGEPVLAIASQSPTRIVGYLRAPNLDAAKPGMSVRVRTRDPHRLTGLATVAEIGTQLEKPPAPLASAVNPAADLGLPVEISLPSNLKIRAGEVVDLTLISQPN